LGSPMKSIIFSKKINTYLVIERIKMALNNFEDEWAIITENVLFVEENGYLKRIIYKELVIKK